MKREFQLLIYGMEGKDTYIISSQHYDCQPSDEEVYKLIDEDRGVKAEVYEVEGDDYSKHLATYEM